VSYKPVLDASDRQVLALKAAWAERGALSLTPEDEQQVLEYLHHHERELALDLLVAGVTDSSLLSPADRQALVDVLLIDWPWERAPVTPEAYADALLFWTPESGQPFPHLT